ncbi:MAG: DNA alkylation repair protein [Bacteroidales bacterium]|nr:DNA alkylation repair protein [Bacteroidales bacterium]
MRDNKLKEHLFALRDEKYAAFQAKLTPGVPAESFIGVRVPLLRKFAKEYAKEAEHMDFLAHLPHEYYDENMLHGLLISQIKDYKECIQQTDAFLPHVDNWAVCDIMSPKVFAKHKVELMEKIRAWSQSSHTYTCRFGLEMLMSHFLDKDFKAEYLQIPASVRSEEYYVRMMVAWFFATALAKQWEATIPYIEQKKLEPWTHNKTIQKAIESYRITDEQKAYLRTLKIK